MHVENSWGLNLLPKTEKEAEKGVLERAKNNREHYRLCRTTVSNPRFGQGIGPRARNWYVCGRSILNFDRRVVILHYFFIK